MSSLFCNVFSVSTINSNLVKSDVKRNKKDKTLKTKEKIEQS